MQSDDVTIEILKGIRDEVRGTNARIVALHEDNNLRFDTMNARFERLEHRLTRTEVRLASELGAVTNAVREVSDLLRQCRAGDARFDDLERRVTALEQRS